MKKLLCILLVLACVVGLFSCTRTPNGRAKSSNSQHNDDATVSDSISSDTPSSDTSSSDIPSSDTSSSDTSANDTSATDTPHVCSFSEELATTQYLKSEPTCEKQATYYYSCSCGKSGDKAFAYGDTLPHNYNVRFAIKKYLKSEATLDSPAIYYYSCKCGAVGTKTFEIGDKLTEQIAYWSTSLTVTLYDTKNSIYGITFNSYELLDEEIIQFRKVGDDAWTDYVPRVEEATAYDSDKNKFTYYVYKAEITLEPGVEYEYRVGDANMEIFSNTATIKARDPNAETFTFVHVSDSQKGPTEFGRVLKSVSSRADFIIHTGDVVQDAIYEYQWSDMLAKNFGYIATVPIMAISGNHETGYTNCYNETYEHFNQNIPAQSSTTKGYYYSFEYGDVKFIMLNTNDLESRKLKSEQYNWLIEELESNTCKWTVVSMHNPLYSVGKWGVNPSNYKVARALQEQLQGIFARYGVDIVLQGHDHTVSKTHPLDGNGNVTNETIETINGINYSVDPSGVIYLMSGASGSDPREADSNAEDYMHLYEYGHGSFPSSWTEFEVSGDTITVTVKYNDNGAQFTYYTWGIKKS